MEHSVVFEQTIQLAQQLSIEERIELMLFLQSTTEQEGYLPIELLGVDVGAWPENLSLSREDIYDDDGR